MTTATTNAAANPTTKAKTKKRTTRRRSTKKVDTSYVPAMIGVGVMAILSALLNGYANSLHAPVAWAGWGMGIATPVIVLLLGKVAGSKWTVDQRQMAYLAGGAGVGLLLLSVWHCAESIALITGSPLLLAAPMAVAIDIGLIACELAIITRK